MVTQMKFDDIWNCGAESREKLLTNWRNAVDKMQEIKVTEWEKYKRQNDEDEIFIFALDILALGAFPCNSKANVFIPWLTEKSLQRLRSIAPLLNLSTRPYFKKA